MLIGEVARRSGVSARMLRHYDAAGLVQPTGRTSGGYREYSGDDIRRLFHVESLRTLGLSLQEVKRALDGNDFAPAELVGDLIRHTRRRIAAEEELLAKLERVDAARPAEWEDVLHIVTLLHALGSDDAAHRQQAILAQDRESRLPVETMVEAYLPEGDLNVAGALQWSLARVPGRGLAELAAGLDADAVEVRRRAVTAIATVRTAAATALLRQALTDPDATVHGRAALALGARGSAEALPALLELVVTGVRDVEAAEILGTLTDSACSADEVVGALQDRFAAVGEIAVQLRITQALAEIPGPAARAALMRLTEHENRTIAATAAAITGASGRERGVADT